MGLYAMTKYYSVCNKIISVNAPSFSTDLGNLRLFEVLPSQTDIKVTCKVAENLPPFPRNGKETESGITVSWQGDDVYRHTPMGIHEGALSRYSVSDPTCSDVYFTHRSYSTFFHFRYFWSSVSLSQLLLPFRVLLFHASYISYKNKAILFSAPCGTGKSTQAELWRIHKDAEIINGDKAGVSIDAEGINAHGLPFSGTSGICKNRSMPLSAIVILGQAKENRIRRLNGTEAIMCLIENIYLDFIAPGEMQSCVDLLIELLKKVPVYRLDCTPDEHAVEKLAKELKI